jgi:hypothetical protein
MASQSVVVKDLEAQIEEDRELLTASNARLERFFVKNLGKCSLTSKRASLFTVILKSDSCLKQPSLLFFPSSLMTRSDEKDLIISELEETISKLQAQRDNHGKIFARQ